MFCPKCNSKSETLDNSDNLIAGERYRKRRCVCCGHIFYTTEYAVECSGEFLNEWAANHRNHKTYQKKKEARKNGRSV